MFKKQAEKAALSPKSISLATPISGRTKEDDREKEGEKSGDKEQWPGNPSQAATWGPHSVKSYSEPSRPLSRDGCSASISPLSEWEYLLRLCVCVCVCVCVLVTQSCLTPCDPLDYSSSGSSVHRISLIKYWSGLPFPSPGDLPYPGNRTQISCTTGRFFIVWATREAPNQSLSVVL